VRDAYFADEAETADAEGSAISSRMIVLTTLVVGLIWLNTGMLGIQPALVSGPSMRPHYGPGDIVMVKDVSARDLKVGDVIKFQAGSKEVIHRIVAITPGSSGTFVFTQGDHNNVADAPVALSAVQGKVVLKIPYAGWVPIKLREWLG